MHEYFAVRAVNHNWRDIIAEAKYLDKDKSVFKNISDVKLDKLGDKVYEKFVTPGMERIKAINLFKVILPGSPTIYNGEDVAETGLESKGKNKYLTNRNRIHFEWLNKPYIRDYNNELKQILNLRKKSELSPLVDGQPVILKKIKNFNNSDNKNLFGLYRYNSERDVIAIMNTAGFDATRKITSHEQKIPYIDTGRQGEFGISGGLQDGTVYVNALKEEDEYIVSDGGKFYKKEDNEEITSIIIDKPALILYRKKSFGSK